MRTSFENGQKLYVHLHGDLLELSISDTQKKNEHRSRCLIATSICKYLSYRMYRRDARVSLTALETTGTCMTALKNGWNWKGRGEKKVKTKPNKESYLIDKKKRLPALDLIGMNRIFTFQCKMTNVQVSYYNDNWEFETLCLLCFGQQCRRSQIKYISYFNCILD